MSSSLDKGKGQLTGDVFPRPPPLKEEMSIFKKNII